MPNAPTMASAAFGAAALGGFAPDRRDAALSRPRPARLSCMRKDISQAIYCVWHNRLALCMKLYFTFGGERRSTAGRRRTGQREPRRRVSLGDSRMFRRAARARLQQPARPQALLELTTWAERGYDLAITPDGPRGPRYVVQEGVMATGASDGPAHRARVVSFELENPV